jgi:hypothetical protein
MRSGKGRRRRGDGEHAYLLLAARIGGDRHGWPRSGGAEGGAGGGAAERGEAEFGIGEDPGRGFWRFKGSWRGGGGGLNGRIILPCWPGDGGVRACVPLTCAVESRSIALTEVRMGFGLGPVVEKLERARSWAIGRGWAEMLGLIAFEKSKHHGRIKRGELLTGASSAG